MTTVDWSLAACDDPELGTPAERADMFYPPPGRNVAAAKQVCARCPLIIECLEGSLERNEEFGVWGGVAGEKQRRKARKAWLQRDSNPEAWRLWVANHLRQLDGINLAVIDLNSDGATHGTAATYNNGCRCTPCKFGRYRHDFKHQPTKEKTA